jgi:hypothetical protein
MQRESTVECNEYRARHSLRAIALIENRALNEQATDPSLLGRQYFSACVVSAANSAEFSKQLGHGKLQTLWMVCPKAGVFPFLSINGRWGEARLKDMWCILSPALQWTRQQACRHK